MAFFLLKALNMLTTATHQELLLQLTSDLMEAWQNKDREKLEWLTHDDFCLISDMVKSYCVGKKDWIGMLMNKYTLVQYQQTIHKIKIRYSGKMASVISKLSILSKPTYTNTPNVYLVTDIWVLEGDEWKLMIRQPVTSPLVQ